MASVEHLCFRCEAKGYDTYTPASRTAAATELCQPTEALDAGGGF